MIDSNESGNYFEVLSILNSPELDMEFEEFNEIKYYLVGEERGFNKRLANLLKCGIRRIENYSVSLKDKQGSRKVDPSVAQLMRILKWMKENKITNPFVEV